MTTPSLRDALAAELHMACVATWNELRLPPGEVVTVHGIDSHYDDADAALKVVADRVASLVAICGRCDGRGTESHQLTRDPKDGRGEHRCPSCQGTGKNRDQQALADALTKEGEG